MSAGAPAPSLQKFVRLLAYMAAFGAVLVILGIVAGPVLRIVPGGAVAAIVAAGAIALIVGIWEHRHFSRVLSRLREER